MSASSPNCTIVMQCCRFVEISDLLTALQAFHPKVANRLLDHQRNH